MRITLIRTLGIAMLAASISGFAQTIDVKNESTAITPASTQQNVSEQKELNQLEKDYKGRVVLDQNHVEMNRVPDPAVIAATRPVMRHIEIALAQQCDLADLPRSVKERCVKVACPALESNAP